jgi:predicted phage terminase large subunit-like protein
VQLSHNQLFTNDFGKQAQFGSWSESSFITTANIAFYCIGAGESPRGTKNGANRPDYIFVDDIDTREIAKNPARVSENTLWITQDLMGCFDVGTARFIMANNRAFKNGVLARMVHEKVTTVSKPYKWHHSIVNAVTNEATYTPTWAAKYTADYWRAKAAAGYRAFQSEYMNNPIEDGNVFSAADIIWGNMLPLEKYIAVVAYCDPSQKDNGDYKAIKIWGKTREGELHLIDCFVRQTSMANTVKWLYDFQDKLKSNQTCQYYMEANFAQDLLMDEFRTEGLRRGYQLPIRKDTRKKGDKAARIENLSPLYERRLITYNIAKKENADFQVAIQQLLAFEIGSRANDDSPDADEGAIFILQRSARIAHHIIKTGNRTSRNNF